MNIELRSLSSLHRSISSMAVLSALAGPLHAANNLPDTGQSGCYSSSGSAISCPAAGETGYGQDAQYQGNAMSYTDHGNGTVTDNVTGIMWQQTTDRDGNGTIDASDKLNYSAAVTYCDNLVLGGHSDWQLPDITQMYSLIDFDGQDVSGYNGTDTSGLTPFIDNTVFGYGYGDTGAGERIIDSQYATSTLYISTTMNGAETMFGVNLADGRIKGYPTSNKEYYVQCARNTGTYGQNNFTDNLDGTVTDSWAGLMWAQDDNGAALDWDDALAWVEQKNAVNYLGYSDWRLPDIKELQSLVDYTRAPDFGSAAIDPLFNATAIINEAGQTDYPYYWSSTTHANSNNVAPGGNAAYISFGRAIGSMNGGSTWIDVHGAGAQRSDPKAPETGVSYPNSHGPQGDAQRVYNYARLVRDSGTGGGESTAYLTNISTRANVSGGQNDAFAGFVISGTGTRQVMLRGMAVDSGTDPNLLLLKLNGSNWESVAVNDEWEADSNAGNVNGLADYLKLPDTYDNDAGLLLYLDPGVYSAQLGTNGSAGLMVVGVDAVDTTSANPELVNISTRAYVSGGQNDAFAGFVISGSGSLKVMLRGIAVDSGTDPSILLLKLNGTNWETVDSNDNWGDHSSASSISALATSLQLPDSYGNDAGMLLNLAAGVYTVQLGSNAGAGLMVVGVDAAE